MAPVQPATRSSSKSERDASSRARSGPGRPSTGGRERILDAALDVLKRDGYAGLTTAKVAARSGQNKALINYHFGSKDGLVAAAARVVREQITEEVLAGIGQARTAGELVEGLVAGIWRVMERDEGIGRIYFDLASQSVVEPEVRAIMRETKERFRAVLRDLLSDLEDGPPRGAIEASTIYLMSGVEGLSLERLERGDTAELRRARAIFVRAAASAIGG